MNPIQWQDNVVRVLDQRKLPYSIEWLDVKTADEMASAIKNMALRGAPLIGIAAAYGLVLEAAKENLIDLKKAAKALREARPTAINLTWALDRVLSKIEMAASAKKSLFDATLSEAIQIHEEDRKLCLQISKFGAEILPQGAVLTHCNTGSLATGGQGTAYGIIKEGFRQGKISNVFACEARPFLQGARLTAFELQQDQIPFTLITDSMAGYLLWLGKIASVVVGADRIAANGDTANKIGTYTLAVLAHENQIPFYVAAPTSSLDRSTPTGKQIQVEERDSREVTEIMGTRIAPQGINVMNPAFDITPAAYISSIVTEKGVLLPPFDERFFSQIEINKGEHVGAS